MAFIIINIIIIWGFRGFNPKAYEFKAVAAGQDRNYQARFFFLFSNIIRDSPRSISFI